tara:strand:- start:1898 stop:2125 length:228 start_codon:yes stop_codon:yes gene_type:complete
VKAAKIGDLVRLNIDLVSYEADRNYRPPIGIVLAVELSPKPFAPDSQFIYKVHWEDIGDTSIWYWEDELEFLEKK